MRRIGVLTSGGDAPGMNAAIRAVVRTAIYEGLEPFGIERGYEGLLEESFQPMDLASVGDIMQRGGTVLKTARSKRFMTEEGRKLAASNMRKHGIDGLVVCGGDGSYRGALDLSKEGIDVIGVPCTIDNDMGYTDFTIGFDTAVNTVLSAIGNIRDTASAHERTSIIEVMGRECGDIALYSGVTGGADCILIPELPVDTDGLCKKIIAGVKRGKNHSIIIKAEGVELPTHELENIITAKTGQEVRTVVLAYLQRGGSPSAKDRMMASLMGSRAVELLMADESNIAVGMDGSLIKDTPLEKAVEIEREADLELLSLIDMLSI
ncbi:MAG: 6-phosphofructokinase [Eubacteriaceae bacterium]|nr:6-phosphofructokinase [Eubacteriaceae bacterium]